jgi:hypothetical protein
MNYSADFQIHNDYGYSARDYLDEQL